MPKAKRHHIKTSHRKASHHPVRTSVVKVAPGNTSIFGHKLTPAVLIIAGAGLIILQGLLALVGFAAVALGIISLVITLFKGRRA